MDNSYYEEKMGQSRKFINLYVYAIDFCVSKSNINKLKRDKVESLIYKLQTTKISDIKEIRKIQAKIVKVMNVKDGSRVFSTNSNMLNEIKRGLPNGAWRNEKNNIISYEHNREEHYAKIKQVLSKGDGSWEEAVIKFVDSYIDEILSLERIEKSKESAAQKEREAAQKRRVNSQNVSETIDVDRQKKDRDLYDKGNGAKVNTSTKSSYGRGSNVGVSSSQQQKDNSVERFLEDIDKALEENNTLNYRMSSKDKSMLYEKLGIYEDRVVKGVEGGVTLLKIMHAYQQYQASLNNPFKKSYVQPSSDDLIRAFFIVVDILPPQLLADSNGMSDKKNFVDKLTTKADVSNSLNNYAVIYNMFCEYYNNLPDDKRNEVRNSFVNKLNRAHPGFVRNPEFVLDDLSPERLRTRVNRVVYDRMVAGKGAESGTIMVDYSKKSVAFIIKATQYMDNDMIANLYDELKYGKKDSYFRKYDIDLEKLQRLQYLFATTILSRENVREMTYEEMSVRLGEICRDLFHEEPLKSLVDVDMIKMRNKIVTKKPEEIQKKIFGLDKLKSTFAKTNKIYNKYKPVIVEYFSEKDLDSKGRVR